MRENISRIEEARTALYDELYQYNHHRVHSTTNEIPDVRFERMMNEKKSMFSSFVTRPPFLTPDDIFCLRWKRTVNAYRKISICNLEFPVHGIPIRSEVEIRVTFDMKTRLAKLRLWYKHNMVGGFLVKAEDLKKVRF